MEDWVMGIGDWGLGIGDWAQSPIPNPHHPESLKNLLFILNIQIIYKIIMPNNYQKL